MKKRVQGGAGRGDKHEEVVEDKNKLTRVSIR